MDAPAGSSVNRRSTAEPLVRVWDRFVRVFHWTLAGSFLGAYLSTSGPRWLHKGFGYTALALVLARLVWGFVGTRPARFSSFVPGPGTLLRYALAMLQRREPRYLTHNPAAAVMILYLLAANITIGVTGVMMTTDAFWGNEAVELVHTLTVDLTLLAIGVHVAAAVYASVHHRENLIAAMVTGDKRAPSRYQRHRRVRREPSQRLPGTRQGLRLDR